MRHNVVQNLVFVLLCTTFFAGCSVTSLSYDYSSSIEFLPEALKPQYDGGIIRNADFNDGLKGWLGVGYSEIAERSKAGNRFAVVSNKVQRHQSISQKVYLHKEKRYTFSAWLQSSMPNTAVTVVFNTTEGLIHAGAVEAHSGCWSMLKGGMTVTVSGPAELYFESKNTTAEIWVDSVSLQPFTLDQWKDHQTEAINKKHKKIVRLQALDGNGNTVAGAKISVHQIRQGFPLGASMYYDIIDNKEYQSWFASRFTVTTFQNEMKWYANEHSEGKEDYIHADAMLAFAKEHNISVRGHNVFWDDPTKQPLWVHSLDAQQLRDASTRRINSVMSRYSGQLIAWDVMNENLHFSFFEDMLGANFTADSFETGQRLDPNTLLFLNEFNTLEQPVDRTSMPAMYLEKLNQIKASGSGLKLAIGLQGHFDTPDLAYIRSALDTLGTAQVPIWLTELDFLPGPYQAQYLEEVMREAYAHPAVSGIIVWSPWHAGNCTVMCLADGNFKNTPAGDVVDKLIKEWRYSKEVGTTDADGFFNTQLVHGEYEVTVVHPFVNSTSLRKLHLDSSFQHGSTFEIYV